MIERLSELFLPDDESWLKHANPWSVWTRFATLPFLIVAIWSRVWIGWYCLLPITMLVFWIFINPRIFNKPTQFDNWGSKAVLGERIYIAKRKEGGLGKHKTPIHILTILQTVGGFVLIYGLWNLDIFSTLYGTTVVYLSKMWFLDRMVWLHADSHGRC